MPSCFPYSWCLTTSAGSLDLSIHRRRPAQEIDVQAAGKPQSRPRGTSPKASIHKNTVNPRPGDSGKAGVRKIRIMTDK